MNIIAFAHSVLSKMMQQLAATIFHQNRKNIDGHQTASESPGTSAATAQKTMAPTPYTNHISSACHKPVRVVQVYDLEHCNTRAGRIVISGRMADVCAELDRLAALEMA